MRRRYRKKKINGRTVFEHRWLMEQHLGRELRRDEHVHHINNDPRDNRLENLQVLSPGDHARHHNDKHPRQKACATCGEAYEPAPTKRERSKTCSRECFRALLSARVGSEKGSAKVTEEQVVEIRARVAAGESQAALRLEFGLSAPGISQLVNRKTWRHVA